MAGKSLTKEEYIDKYGTSAWEIRRKKYSMTLESAIKKYGLEEGTKKFEEKRRRDKIKGTLTGYIERYGEIDGPIKYAEKNSRLSVGVDALKKNGFSDDEITNIRKLHADKSAMTLDNFILRYGEIEGTIKQADWLSKSRDRCNTNIPYWVKRGFSESEAKEIIRERQATSTLDKFITKYGIEEGAKKYLDVNKRKTRNWFGNTISKLESAFFESLSRITYINDKGISCRLRFDERSVVCDYLDASKNRVIEINGDFWHMNPNKFKPHDVNMVTERVAQDIWDAEKYRNGLLMSKGYEILIIWESELNEDYDRCLELAKIFLEK
jgi:G:T-mismatch repair DNA endonuclease (very short patch repair protein)